MILRRMAATAGTQHKELKLQIIVKYGMISKVIMTHGSATKKIKTIHSTPRKKYLSPLLA